MNFLKRIIVDENGCWIYQGATRKKGMPYGWVAYKKTQMNAHRASWIHSNGEIPEGLNVCHKCDVPQCINPEHLFLGTQKENILDMWNKKRHPKINLGGEKSPAAKLTLEQVREIRFMLSQKIKQKFIAEKFKISQVAISNIKNKKRWQLFE
jgi:hypothetical protein